MKNKIINFALACFLLLSPLLAAGAEPSSVVAEDIAASPETADDLLRPTLEVDISRENFDNPLVQIETSRGLIILELFPREAPEAVTNFIGLAEGSKPFTDPYSGELVNRPFYDGLIFHRVIDQFMIQGGSPDGLGTGGPGYSFNDEISARSLGLDRMMVLDADGYPHEYLGIQDQSDFQARVLRPLYRAMGINSQQQLEDRLPEIEEKLNSLTLKEHYESEGYEYNDRLISRVPLKGVIAMANSGPNTNGSQFFITLIDTPWLTGKYTVFGKVRYGMEVVEAIGRVPVDNEDRPLTDVIIYSIRSIAED